MPASAERLYKAHVLNLRAVNTALEKLFLDMNRSLARSDQKTSDALLKTSMLLLGAWAENRLQKLMFEPNGFSIADRETIYRKNSQYDCWKYALELGFRKRYGVPRADLNLTLQITPRSYYRTLSSILENDLKPIIEIRNKLAHGQWSRTFNNDSTDFSPESMRLLNAENAFTVKCKRRILDYLAQIIHDLVAGNAAFERDIDQHFCNLENAKRDIENRDYSKWLNSLLIKYNKGVRLRKV